MRTIIDKLQTLGERRVLLYIIIVSVALRIPVALVFGDHVVELPGTADQISYHTLALRLLTGHGFSFGENWWPATRAGEPTAHWSFLYTFYLVGVYGLFGAHPLAARLIQALIAGILQPLFAFHLGKQAFNAKIGLLGATLTTVYAYFIYYTGTLMTEPFYITTILAGLYLALRLVDQASTSNATKLYGTGAALGIVLAAAVLLRQLFLLFLPFLFLWLLWKLGWRKIGSVLLAGSLVVGSIVPFTVYNFHRYNRLVLLNTNAGYAFFWGNHPRYGTHFVSILPSEEYTRMIPRELLGLDEAALDQELLKRSFQFITEDPARYLALSFSRIPAYFMFWPSGDSGVVSNVSRVTSFGILWPFMLAGILRSLIFKPWTIRRWLSQPVFLLELFVGVYTVIHLLTWALIRYRLPVDAVMLLFAAQAMLVGYQWLERRTSLLQYPHLSRSK